jgi:hypothetical protein
MGISGEGANAERLYCQYTGAEQCKEPAKGDAILDGHFIEIKRATSNTLNQVRAVKYTTMVAYHEPSDTWYVVPAHEIVRQVSRKNRGQHTENPFESATLSIANLGHCRVDSAASLREATLKAIAESANRPDLQAAMAEVLVESKEVAARSVEKVRPLVED